MCALSMIISNILRGIYFDPFVRLCFVSFLLSLAFQIHIFSAVCSVPKSIHLFKRDCRVVRLRTWKTINHLYFCCNPFFNPLPGCISTKMFILILWAKHFYLISMNKRFVSNELSNNFSFCCCCCICCFVSVLCSFLFPIWSFFLCDSLIRPED